MRRLGPWGQRVALSSSSAREFLLVLILSCSIVNYSCALNTHRVRKLDQVDKNLNSSLVQIFPDARMRQLIGEYLEAIPLDQAAKKAANRAIGIPSGSKNRASIHRTFIERPDDTGVGAPNHSLKQVITRLLHLWPACLPNIWCQPCKKPNCNLLCPKYKNSSDTDCANSGCPTCPIPDGCPTIAPGEKCPSPEGPTCKPCTSSKPMLTTQIPVGTSTRGPNMKPTISILKPEPKPGPEPVPEPMPMPEPTLAPAGKSTQSPQSNSNNSSKKPDAKPRSTTAKSVMNSTLGPTIQTSPHPKGSTTPRSKMQTSAQPASIATSQPAMLRTSANTEILAPSKTLKPKTYKPRKAVNVNERLFQSKDELSKFPIASTIINPIQEGAALLTLANLDSDLYRKLMELINSIPLKVGGRQHKLSRAIMREMGKPAKSSIKDGTRSRNYTPITARTNFYEFIDDLASRIFHIRCKCPKCSYTSCDCSKRPTCMPKVSDNCKPCKNACPVPEGCPKVQPKRNDSDLVDKSTPNKLDCPPCPNRRSQVSLIEVSMNPKKFMVGGEFYRDVEGSVELDPRERRMRVKPQELTKEIICKSKTVCKYRDSCGAAPLNKLTPNSTTLGYMVGGSDQQYGEWPSFARIVITQFNKSSLCGGALISDRHVLTAGHCFTDLPENMTKAASMVRVTLAENNWFEHDKFEQVHSVKTICRSKHYYAPNEALYDFTVLTLDKPAIFNDHVRPACLPFKHIDLDNSKCFVVGLGVTKFDKSKKMRHSFPDMVQKMQIKPYTCNLWGITNADRSRHCFTKAMGEGDTCNGDSGGPVLCLDESNKRWTVVGLVSYGTDFCDGVAAEGWTGVYTRVRYLLDMMQNECEL